MLPSATKHNACNMNSTKNVLKIEWVVYGLGRNTNKLKPTAWESMKFERSNDLKHKLSSKKCPRRSLPLVHVEKLHFFRFLKHSTSYSAICKVKVVSANFSDRNSNAVASFYIWCILDKNYVYYMFKKHNILKPVF